MKGNERKINGNERKIKGNDQETTILRKKKKSKKKIKRFKTAGTTTAPDWRAVVFSRENWRHVQDIL